MESKANLTMARRKRTQLDHDALYERWKIFGEWLTQQRLYRGLTQDQAAQAVGVSRQQRIRYELGAKVLKKRMRLMAKTLNVPLEKMHDRAGFTLSLKRNAAKDRLGRLYDLLCAGRLDFAILELLRLDYRVNGDKGSLGPRSGGLEATYFSNAVVMINKLPSEHLNLILEILPERIKDTEDDFEYRVQPDGKSLIRKKRQNVILWD